MVEIVGRQEELGAVHAFLDREAAGAAALVLEGEAGIGKSTLWLAAVQAASERGLRLLSSRPAEAERELAHAALGDLLEDVLPDVLPSLSASRRRALEVALLVEEAAGPALDPRALAVAVRTALQLLAENGRVVLAIDDVQWLDSSSASALGFALRRLGEEEVLVLLARRLGEGAETSELEQALGAERVQQLRVGPLNVGATKRLLQSRLGFSFPRPTLLRLHEASGGNPFYALEMARALSAHGATGDPTQPLPIPDTLEGLVRARLGGLPEATHEALVLASAMGRASPALLEAAGVGRDVLDPALAAHVLERENGMLRFTHPLLASVLYNGLPPEKRRRVHARLAETIADPLARARHLALAAIGPDADVAAGLEQAAQLAGSRGAILAAAELCEYALRLTPARARDDHHRRTKAAAHAHFLVGEPHRAHALAHDLLTQAGAGPARAEVLVLLSDATSDGDLERKIALRRQALGEATTRPELQAEIHLVLSGAVRITEGIAAAERNARAALEIADRLDNDALRAGALAALSFLRFTTAEPDGLRMAEEANDLAARSADPQQRLTVGLNLARLLFFSFHLERARALLESLYEEWRGRDDTASASILPYLGLVELAAGRFALAADHADHAREIRIQYATDGREFSPSLWLVALVAAHRGELDRARSLAEEGRILAEGPGLLSWQEGVLGLVGFWSGDAREAAARFAAADEARKAAEVIDPGMVYWWRADQVEALLKLGRIDEAVATLDRWEADAARLGREWVLAQATRCRGLVAAAEHDLKHAQFQLEQASIKHEAVGDPFGRARALLELGVVRRRARQQRAGREAIEAGLAAFEALGAASWAETARRELGRIGGRRRQEGLTPAERRVAALVAQGRTNREVAAALFLSERTVASHLSHIYGKLGVRSRTELARHLR